ncbi:MAG: hypothetical protein FJW30_04425 [Acidobacteria bacterium]|nr:hypothetical protein [Acidobacteriota bacterium]
MFNSTSIAIPPAPGSNHLDFQCDLLRMNASLAQHGTGTSPEIAPAAIEAVERMTELNRTR